MTARFRFMGEQEDPELGTWIDRAMTRIYDGTVDPDGATLRWLREPYERSPGSGPGVVVLTGGGACACGRCLFESRCPEAA